MHARGNRRKQLEAARALSVEESVVWKSRNGSQKGNGIKRLFCKMVECLNVAENGPEKKIL